MEIVDGPFRRAWNYDALGRVTGKGQTVGSVTKSIGYGYSNGQLSTITLPSGQLVTYGYNSNNQVTSVTVGSTVVPSNVLYDPFGPVTGWSWGNGTLMSRTYGQDGKLEQFDSAGLKTYSYDDAFRITGISDQEDAANSWSYGYDLLDRVTSASKTGTALGWTYDANGNRLSQTGTQTANYVIATTSNRINSISGTPIRTYTYDAAGNTTGYVGLAFNYSNAGRMIAATRAGITTNYVINAVGQRVKKISSASTQYFIYDESGHLIGEYDGAGAMVRETVWLGDIPVATLGAVSGGIAVYIAVYYVHTDQLNTPRRISQPSDNSIIWRWDSDPSGSSVANDDPDLNGATFTYNSRFPGQFYDAESGLHYNYTRNFDPASGRYVESDPVGIKGGLNTYSYVANNPLAWSDPWGLAPWEWDGIGDTSVCTYYETQAQWTKCDYYKNAAATCRGQRSDINALLRIGIIDAWLRHKTSASQSQITEAIRRGLITYDRMSRSTDSSGGCGGCPRGDWIDLYHSIVFENAGISPSWYGGNIVPQSIWPNYVPYDPHGNPSWDPRQLFLE